MTKDQDERLVASFERIASAIEGIHGSSRTAIRKLWPERTLKEVVVTRVPTEEDRIRERQGASNKPVTEWLSESFGGEEEFIGVRERAFLEEKRKRDAGAETAQGQEHGKDGGSAQEAGS